MKFAFLLALIGCFVFVSPRSAYGQCLTKDDISSLVRRLDLPPPSKPNSKLKNELVKLASETQEMRQEYVRTEPKKESLTKRLKEQDEKNTAKLCQAIKEFGWPTSALVEQDGVEAAFYLLKTSAPFEMQRDLLPVIVAAARKDRIQKPEMAGLLDGLRVKAGMKQIFGTQALNKDGFLILYPIEDEARVDQRRAQFELGPMADHLKNLEREYQTPVVRSRTLPNSELNSGVRQSIADTLDSTLLDSPAIAEDDVIRTNINLVNLNVSVFNEKSRTFVSALTKEDFQVFEDGQEQTVSYFASTEVPFDLVLLIDLSGSTERKRDLIKQSTQRFIEAARPSDRIAIETFSDKVTVISPLTSDRAQLLASVKEIKGGGGSRVWDALKFAMDNIDSQKTLDRRRAVVIMTDGVDNALAFFGGDFGSQITFADLLQSVRETDTLVVPIYLDTESDDSPTSWSRREYQNARNTLAALAEESGGSFYKAKKISDLNGVYEQVINDLGKIYSLGYKPTNDKRDATWRNVEVKVLNRPDLIAHARPGYYAK
jgi:VWFA-related protein